MMKKSRNILTIDLATQEYTFKSYPEINHYIGGQAVSSFLLKNILIQEKVPTSYVSITTGPFCGVFPYASKGIITFYKNGIYKNYIGGGKISSFLNFSSLDSIQLLNESPVPLYLEITGRDVHFIQVTDLFNSDGLGLSGRRSKVEFTQGEISVDNYFNFGNFSEFNMQNNLLGLVYSPLGEFSIKDIDNYHEITEKIYSKESELMVVRGSFPSCYGCPMGCALSKTSETLNVSIMPRSLISCAYAEPIYSDLNLIFSCFSSLGLEYDHEFLELFPMRVGELNRELSTILEAKVQKN